MEFKKNKTLKILILLVLLIFVSLSFSTPATALEAEWTPCEDENTNLQDSIQLLFIIFSVLGPVVGTLFFVGLSLAAAVNTENQSKYLKQRNKSLITGFSIPVLIVLLEEIAQLMTMNTDISCFFP